jgi:hypothetical protein
MQFRGVGAFWLLLLPLLCHAQLGTEGSILGNVQDSSGGAVAGAMVKVTNTDTGFAKTVATDSHGFFQVVALPLGTYSVEASGADLPLGRSQE